MQRIRTSSPLLRLAVALLFGFMSLGHWPVMMAFAGGPSPAAHHHASHGPEHHHAATHAGHAAEPADIATTDLQPTCHAIGCFVVMAPTPIKAPTAAFTLLDQLSPGPADRIDPTVPQPADRPPRLQA